MSPPNVLEQDEQRRKAQEAIRRMRIRQFSERGRAAPDSTIDQLTEARATERDTNKEQALARILTHRKISSGVPQLMQEGFSEQLDQTGIRESPEKEALIGAVVDPVEDPGAPPVDDFFKNFPREIEPKPTQERVLRQRRPPTPPRPAGRSEARAQRIEERPANAQALKDAGADVVVPEVPTPSRFRFPDPSISEALRAQTLGGRAGTAEIQRGLRGDPRVFESLDQGLDTPPIVGGALDIGKALSNFSRAVPVGAVGAIEDFGRLGIELLSKPVIDFEEAGLPGVAEDLEGSPLLQLETKVLARVIPFIEGPTTRELKAAGLSDEQMAAELEKNPVTLRQVMSEFFEPEGPGGLVGEVTGGLAVGLKAYSTLYRGLTRFAMKNSTANALLFELDAAGPLTAGVIRSLPLATIEAGVEYSRVKATGGSEEEAFQAARNAFGIAGALGTAIEGAGVSFRAGRRARVAGERVDFRRGRPERQARAGKDQQSAGPLRPPRSASSMESDLNELLVVESKLGSSKSGSNLQALLKRQQAKRAGDLKQEVENALKQNAEVSEAVLDRFPKFRKKYNRPKQKAPPKEKPEPQPKAEEPKAKPPPKAEAPPRPRHTDTKKAQTGEPFEGELFHGFGRETKAGATTGGMPPILGDARYTTPSAEFAGSFGPTVARVKVTLDNPLVIRDDDQWRAITKAAGLRFPRLSPELGVEANQADVNKLRKYIEGQGHDGVIIDLDPRGDMAKTLRSNFGDDTVVDFKGTAGRARGAERRQQPSVEALRERLATDFNERRKAARRAEEPPRAAAEPIGGPEDTPEATQKIKKERAKETPEQEAERNRAQDAERLGREARGPISEALGRKAAPVGRTKPRARSISELIAGGKTVATARLIKRGTNEEIVEEMALTIERLSNMKGGGGVSTRERLEHGFRGETIVINEGGGLVGHISDKIQAKLEKLEAAVLSRGVPKEQFDDMLSAAMDRLSDAEKQRKATAKAESGEALNIADELRKRRGGSVTGIPQAIPDRAKVTFDGAVYEVNAPESTGPLGLIRLDRKGQQYEIKLADMTPGPRREGEVVWRAQKAPRLVPAKSEEPRVDKVDKKQRPVVERLGGRELTSQEVLETRELAGAHPKDQGPVEFLKSQGYTDSQIEQVFPAGGVAQDAATPETDLFGKEPGRVTSEGQVEAFTEEATAGTGERAPQSTTEAEAAARATLRDPKELELVKAGTPSDKYLDAKRLLERGEKIKGEPEPSKSETQQELDAERGDAWEPPDGDDFPNPNDPWWTNEKGGLHRTGLLRLLGVMSSSVIGGAVGAGTIDDDDDETEKWLKVLGGAAAGAVAFTVGVGVLAWVRRSQRLRTEFGKAYTDIETNIDFFGTIQGDISSRLKGSFWNRLRRSQFLMANSNVPIEMVGEQLLRHNPKLPPTKNPAKQLALQKSSGNTFHLAMNEGVLDPMTREIVGPSLKSIFAPFEGDDKAIRHALTYVVAKRLVGRGPKSFGHKAKGNSKADDKAAMDRFDATFDMVAGLEAGEGGNTLRAFSNRLNAFTTAILSYAVRSGMYTMQDAARIVQSDLLFIPFRRILGGFRQGRATGAGGRLTNVAGPIMKFRGSQRPLLDPSISLVEWAKALIYRADEYRVGAALMGAIDDTPALSYLVTPIAHPNLRNIEMERFAEFFKQHGIDVGEMTNAFNDLFVGGFDPKNPLIWRRNPETGKREYAVVNSPDLWNSLAGMRQLEPNSLTELADKLFLPLKRIFVAATTGANPRFFGGINPARDVAIALQQTRTSTSRIFFNAAFGFVEAIARATGGNKLAKWIKSRWPAVSKFRHSRFLPGEFAHQSERHGLGNVNIYSHETNPRSIARRLAPTSKPDKFRTATRSILEAPLRALENLGGASDQGPRVAEIRGRLQAMGYNISTGAMDKSPKRIAKIKKAFGVDPTDWTEADYWLAATSEGRDISLDFQNSPASPLFRYFARYVPFAGPSIQAPFRFAQAGRENPKRFIGVGIGVALLAAWAWLRHQKNKELSDAFSDRDANERAGFLLIPNGSSPHDGYFRYPFAPEQMLIVAAIQTGLEEWKKGKDVKGFRVFERAIERMLPPGIGDLLVDREFVVPIPGINAILENAKNRQSFGGNPIEPREFEGLEVWARYRASTPATAHVLATGLRFLGIENVSPLQAENLIRDVFNSATPLVTDFIDPFARVLGGPGASTKKIPRRQSFLLPFKGPALSARSESERQYYELRQKFMRSSATFKRAFRNFNQWELQHFRDNPNSVRFDLGATFFGAEIFLKQWRMMGDRVIAQRNADNIDGKEARRQIESIRKQRQLWFRHVIAMLRVQGYE